MLEQTAPYSLQYIVARPIHQSIYPQATHSKSTSDRIASFLLYASEKIYIVPMAAAAPRTRTHGVHVFSVFEAGQTAGDVSTRNFAWQSVHSEISCAGVSADDLAEHPVILSAYGAAADGLQTGTMYALKSKLIGSNDSRPDRLYHEAAHSIAVGLGAHFTGNLINNTAITSLGIITHKEMITEPQFNGKNTLVITLRHTDYDPVARMSVEFFLDYLCRPVRNLENCHAIFQLGREVMVSAVVVDWSEVKKCWVGELYSVAVCTGHEVIHPRAPIATPAAPGAVTPGRARLPRRGGPGTTNTTASTPPSTYAANPQGNQYGLPAPPAPRVSPAFISPDGLPSPSPAGLLNMPLSADLTAPHPMISPELAPQATASTSATREAPSASAPRESKRPRKN